MENLSRPYLAHSWRVVDLAFGRMCIRALMRLALNNRPVWAAAGSV